jgi:hypothetical protein
VWKYLEEERLALLEQGVRQAKTEVGFGIPVEEVVEQHGLGRMSTRSPDWTFRIQYDTYLEAHGVRHGPSSFLLVVWEVQPFLHLAALSL